MKIIRLVRGTSHSWGTPGEFLDGDKLICKSLELPWVFNHRGRSCIPTGEYVVRYMERSGSGKYRDVYHVTEVQGRSAILIHKANFAGDVAVGLRTDLLGCIAPVTRYGRLYGQMAGLASAGAMRKLHAATGRKDFILEVSNA